MIVTPTVTEAPKATTAQPAARASTAAAKIGTWSGSKVRRITTL